MILLKSPHFTLGETEARKADELAYGPTKVLVFTGQP